MSATDEPAARPPQGPGPTDIHDTAIRHEAKRAAVWIGMAALVVLVVMFAQPLLVIVGGIVFATMVDGGARLLGRVLPIPRGYRITIVLLLTAAFLVWAAMFAGSQIAAQAAEMPEVIERQTTRAMAWAQSHGFDVNWSDFSTIARQMVSGVGPVTRMLGGIFGGLTTLFLIVVLGVYIAAEPRLYERGLAWMLPAGNRDSLYVTLERMGSSLRRLLAGRLLGMFIEGFATWLALEIYGVPMAALLGLLTGLLAFLPNIGAPISGALMIMVGFSGGTAMGVYTIIVYAVVQFVDSNIIIPLVAKKTVDLAPALVLGAQLVLGVMFGILGLALADPIVAMLKIALERQSERNDQAAEDAAAEPVPG